MGGSTTTGNMTPSSEFNVWHDPEAAKIVFQSGVPIFMAGLNVTVNAGLTEDDVTRLNQAPTKAGKFASELMDFYKIWRFRKKVPVYAIHDPVPVAWLLHPEIFETKMCYVEVDLHGEYTRGCTVTDMLNVTGNKPNVEVCLDVDREAFANLLVDAAYTLK